MNHPKSMFQLSGIRYNHNCSMSPLVRGSLGFTGVLRVQSTGAVTSRVVTGVLYGLYRVLWGYMSAGF